MMRVERRLEGYNTLEIRRSFRVWSVYSYAWASFILRKSMKKADSQRLCFVYNVSNYGTRIEQTVVMRHFHNGLQASFAQDNTHYNWQNVDIKSCMSAVGITIRTARTGHAASNLSSSAPDLWLKDSANGTRLLHTIITQPLNLVYTLLGWVICYSEPSFVFSVNDIIHSVKLLTTEVGNRFFAVSTSLTQATANSKEGLKRKGAEKKDTEKRKAQSEPKCPSAIQMNSDGSKSRFSRQRQEREELYTTQGFTEKDYGCRFIGAWREEKTEQEGRNLQATSSRSSDSDKNKKKSPPDTHPKPGINCPI
ncbi:hypothetical protein K435DRAFT_802148 [Dendrothele bispora CBS 962.96]|uniref:Uncharacterized protein n=1 Tax=Dendrothele bispora (strain CBS 962.96) TaxID=1314807 RepID=A0A4S8LMQ4_DENBC|nr:hypothetical protein K435DRAFT_802148 [Dendrothele bispora CBS 962.96]